MISAPGCLFRSFEFLLFERLNYSTTLLCVDVLYLVDEWVAGQTKNTWIVLLFALVVPFTFSPTVGTNVYMIQIMRVTSLILMVERRVEVRLHSQRPFKNLLQLEARVWKLMRYFRTT